MWLFDFGMMNLDTHTIKLNKYNLRKMMNVSVIY
jgi:hypothetical protein